MRYTSIIVPTYKEVEALPYLIEELAKVQKENNLTFELLIMDDNSRDGTEELIKKLNLPWVHLVVRTSNKGLSPSVIDGFKLTQYDTLVVMDADLSHPPNTIPKMLKALDEGYDLIIGSRYVDQAGTEESWGWFRKLNSRIAGLMARPLTKIKDPMSGFFAFRKELLSCINNLNPVGYKIGLELLIKSNAKKIKEIPIFFVDRKHGHSKLSVKEQLKYIRHLRRLYIFKYPEWAYLSQFLVVGIMGIFLNLGVLSLALMMGASVTLSLILGISVSLIFNFYLNRRFSFSYSRKGKISTQFIGFAFVCLLGAILNLQTAILSLSYFPNMSPQVAEIIGIAVATLFNYTLSRYVIFRDKPIKTTDEKAEEN